MIKFDSSIKYFLYAVALVVITILFYTQIKNWNEARKAAFEKSIIFSETYPEVQSQIKTLVNQIFKDGAAKKLKELDEYHLNNTKFSRLGNDAILSYQQGKELEEAFYGNNKVLSYSLVKHKVDVFDDVAISSSHLDLTAVVEQDTIGFKLKVSLIFVDKNGKWKIVHEHISSRE